MNVRQATRDDELFLWRMLYYAAHMGAHVEHALHFVDASDALCKRQLRDRSKNPPAGTPWTTEAEFEAITVYVQPPSEDERFNVVRHERHADDM